MIFHPFRKKTRPRAFDPSADSTDFLTGDPAIDRRSLQLLLDVMAEVGSTVELERLARGLVDKSVEVTKSERGILLLGARGAPAGAGGALRVEVARDAAGDDLGDEIAYSTTIASGVFETGEPATRIVRSGDEAMDLAQSVYDLKLRAVMCVPLVSRGGQSGVIYVDSRAQDKEYSRRDLAFFAALAQQLTVALDNAWLHKEALERERLAKELEFARRIQERLLPEPRALPADLGVATWFRACEAMAGDTFDIVTRDDGRLAVLLGDVTGHGIGPALIAHSAQAATRSYLEVLDDLCLIVTKLNERFVEGVEAGHFMSLFVACLDTRDDGRRFLRYVNAGHGGSYFVSARGACALDPTAPAIGMSEGIVFGERSSESFEPGDFLFLCSDGLTEARNAERDLLGEGELLRVLAALHGRPAREVIAGVRALLDAHQGGCALEDDVVLLALSAGPAPGRL